MNQKIKNFYKYQPIRPECDLISFEEIPEVDNPSRLVQVAHYDIEITAWLNEKELQINIRERGAINYNDLRIRTDNPIGAMHGIECLFHVMSIGLGPTPVQIIG